MTVENRLLTAESRIPRSAPDAERRAQRERLIAWRQALSSDARHRVDQALTRTLRLELSRRPLGVLAVYWPIRGEFDPIGACDAWARAGGRFALPRTRGTGTALEFGRWTPGQPMQPGPWGAALPDPFEPVTPTLLLVPCVGYSEGGLRLGYGGGFYDRTLASLRVPTIGLAYDACEVTDLAPEPHDVPMDCIITEQRILRPGGR